MCPHDRIHRLVAKSRARCVRREFALGHKHPLRNAAITLHHALYTRLLASCLVCFEDHYAWD
jgi:hypothetical protein